MSEPRRVGGRAVNAVGFGAMQLSEPHRPDEDEAVRVLVETLEAGCNLIDTADAYCLGPQEIGHNERLVARALREWGGDRDDVIVATKGGHTRRPDGSWDLDGSPQHLRQACEASLRALEVDVLDLYQFHRPDPEVPFEESVGTLAELREQGKIRLAGVSNANLAQIDQAVAIADVVSVQNEFSPWFTSSASELARCEELGIAFLCWAPLGGTGRVARAGELLPAFGQMAEERQVTPQQLILAWEVAQGSTAIPIPGTRRSRTMLENLAAASIELDADELRRLDACVAAHGRR
jgi:aryl-alcohol dehydrogenase-like predicted oxidoreductase